MPYTTNKLPLFNFVLIASLLFSCSKKNDEPKPNIFESAQGIYMGVDIRSAPYGTAALWKNDVVQTLGEGHTVDITRNGTDIYTLGMSDNELFYWKNDVRTLLQKPTQAAGGTYVRHIAVAGTDVYITGYYYDKSSSQVQIYWKNGVPFETPGSSFWMITASGNDIYMMGLINGKVGYTKNGVATYVENFQPSGIAVSGTDVYLYGSVLPTTFNPYWGIWKNGTVTNIGTEIQLDAIYIKGTDVYLAGLDYYKGGTYWKNGVATRFGQNGNAGGITGMYVDKNDNVYVAGEMSTGEQTGVACYWKNGNRVDLTIKGSSAKGIVGIE